MFVYELPHIGWFPPVSSVMHLPANFLTKPNLLFDFTYTGNVSLSLYLPILPILRCDDLIYIHARIRHFSS